MNRKRETENREGEREGGREGGGAIMEKQLSGMIMLILPIVCSEEDKCIITDSGLLQS